tara:strand:- start:1809 stop:2282 length:474 start_codon:yes stop_codon:yes gene_type:complete
MASIRRFGAPVIKAQWATPDAPTDFDMPMDPNISIDGMRESAMEKRALPAVSSDPTKKSDPLAYSGAVPLPGAAAAPALTGLTSSGIAYDEGAYGPWHYYHSAAGQKDIADAPGRGVNIHTINNLKRLAKMRTLPSGVMGIPDDWEKAKALERSRRG